MAREFERPPWWAVVVMVVGLVWLGVGIPLAAGRGGEPLSKAELDRMAAAASAADASEAASRPISVAFLGDSWAAGTGADRPETAFPYLAAQELGWQATVNGQGATGYTTNGGDPNKSVYLDRVAQTVQGGPDVVVVEGSINDRGRGRDEIRAAAHDVFAAIKEQDPDVILVVLGASFVPALSDTSVQVTKDAVSAAAAEFDATWIDPAGWLDVSNGSLWLADGKHPSQAGHQLLADRLAEALRALRSG